MATTDWTQQMEEATRQWTDMQRKLWSTWGETAKQATTKVQTKAMWQQMLDMWRNAVHRMLDMQVETARLWAENVNNSETLEGVAQWADQSYEMTKQWSIVQKQMWDSWFQMVEKIDPTQMNSMLEMENQPVMKFWKDMSQQATAMQQDWMKVWTAWQPTQRDR